MVITKIFTSRRHVFAVYLTSVSRDSPPRTVYMAKSNPPSRVPQASRQGAPGMRATLSVFEAFSKETYEKLALPE